MTLSRWRAPARRISSRLAQSLTEVNATPRELRTAAGCTPVVGLLSDGQHRENDEQAEQPRARALAHKLTESPMASLNLHDRRALEGSVASMDAEALAAAVQQGGLS